MNGRIKENGELVIENGQLLYRNFRGLASDNNAAGNRNFSVLLNDEIAAKLEEEGWYVKRRRPKEDDPEQYQEPYLNVKVKFSNYPPVLYLITKKGKTKLTEETVGDLDRSIITSADLTIRPYHYPARNGRPEGISAYLKYAYISVQDDDDFADRYADLPYVDANGGVIVENLRVPEEDEEVPFE